MLIVTRTRRENNTLIICVSCPLLGIEQTNIFFILQRKKNAQKLSGYFNTRKPIFTLSDMKVMSIMSAMSKVWDNNPCLGHSRLLITITLNLCCSMGTFFSSVRPSVRPYGCLDCLVDSLLLSLYFIITFLARNFFRSHWNNDGLFIGVYFA